MKISFENKVLIGFIVNLSIVIGSGWIFISHLEEHGTINLHSILNMVGFFLFGLSIVLLTIVYFFIRKQFQETKFAYTLLAENKTMLQSIIDNTSNPIFIKKLNGEYLLVNKQYEALFQLTSKEIIGKTDHDFLPKETADTYRHSDLEVVKALKELKFEETIQQSDGVHTYLAVKFPLYDTRGKVYAVGGISIDITERKKTEESIKAGDKFFNMSINIMAIASHEKFLKVNPAMSRLLGYTEEELLTESYSKFIFPEDLPATKREIERLLTGIPVIRFENRYVCKNGTIKWLSWSASGDPETRLFYAIANDITEEKDVRQSLLFAEKFFNMAFNIFFLAKGENIIKINPALTRTFGFELKDFENKSFLSFVHPDDVAATAKELKKLLGGGTVISFRVRSITKSGLYRWVDWTATSDVQTGVIFAAGRDVTELIESEESLQVANSFFENSFDAFLVAKPDKIIKINPAFTKTFGYTLNELKNKSLIEFIRPDYAKIAAERLAKRLKGEPVESNVELPILTKDGSYKWVEVMITTNTKNGTLYGILEDITEKKLNEEKILEYTEKIKNNEQQVQTIFNSAPDPVIVIDDNSRILRWNPKAEAVFGWKAAEVLEKPLYEFIIPERHRESHKTGVKTFLSTGTGPVLNATTEIEAVNKEGAEFPISMSISPAKQGEKNVFIGFVRDISASKKAIKELYEQEETLRLILENIAEGVVVADANKKIVMANDMANSIFGIQANNQIATNLINQFQLFYPDGKTVFPAQNLPIERVFRGEQMDDVEIMLYNPTSKEKKRVLISARPLLGEDSKVIAAVVTIKDISKYKQMEAELKEARKLIGFNKGEDLLV